MNKDAVSVDLPVGAKVRHREPVRDKSIELAEQLARRGASESLVRAMGGDEAVTKFKGKETDMDTGNPARA